MSGLPVVRKQGEGCTYKHDEEDLESAVAVGPGEKPVSYGAEPGEDDKDEVDDELHAHEAGKVDEGLLCPPGPFGWVAVKAGLHAFVEEWVVEFGEEVVDETEDEDEDANTDGGL